MKMLKSLLHTPSGYSTRRLLQWLWGILRHHRLQAGINTLLGCLTVCLDFAFIWATKRTIDIATHQTPGQLSAAAALLVGILLSQLCIGFASRWVKAILGVKAQNHMQLSYFDRLLHSEWQDRNRRHSGDILNRLERDVLDVVNTVTETVPSMAAVCLRLLGAFFFLYAMDATLACTAVAIIPLFMLLSKLYMRKMRRLTRDIRDTDSRVQSLLQETIQHQMVVQTMERQSTMVRRLDQIQRHLRGQVRTRTLFSSTSAALLSAGFMGCYLFAFLWGAVRLHEGTITYGMMIAFIQLVGQIQGPFRDMTRFIPVFVGAFTAGERLMQLEEIPLEKKKAQKEFRSTPGILFRRVTCSYSPESRRILEDFSYDFPPGSHTAVVGETGAGKTTLIRLMLALLRPTSGEILLYDGTEQVPCDAGTRSHFTYVPQGNTLFSGTIRDNLLMGDPRATEEEMRAALSDACAGFVFQLPQGLDSRCGEQGTGLSEGQAQRIAIARALLRPGGILLFDEATSALDTETERQLWRNITRRCGGKTLIFVTHRTEIITPGTRVLHISK